MRIGTGPPVHLCYCSNIHPGETWTEVRANLQNFCVAVKQQVAPRSPFGIGLRLSGCAVEELSRPQAVEELQRFFSDQGIYVFTINAFPYGRFHGAPVKENVYLPDWRMPERVAYSNAAAMLLARLLPEDVDYGSVSTVPGGFRSRVPGKPEATEAADGLLAHAATLYKIAQQTGREIVTALEPEPACMLETTTDAAAYFEATLLSRRAVARFSNDTGLRGDEAEQRLRNHLGVCLDTCHAAVEFEDPAEAVHRLQRAGIRIAKVQISTGLCFPGDAREQLAAFADDVYLHQVVKRRGGKLSRFDDIPAALHATAGSDPSEEWRVHFHVPIFRRRLGAFASTQDFLRSFLAIQRDTPITQHLEIETYTWELLPEQYRNEGVVGAVVREIDWACKQLAS